MRGDPAGALGAATREALRLADTLERMLGGLRAALEDADRTRIEDTRRLDDVLDRLTTAIKDYVMAVEPSRLTTVDARTVARILAFVINLEQAGDLVDRILLDVVARRLQRGVSFSAEGQADLVAQVDRLVLNTRQAAALFLSGDPRAAHALAAEKAALREIEEQATASHFERLRLGDVQTLETSGLHLDALRDLKRVNAHLVEAAAYPILRQNGDLLPSRIRRMRHPQSR